MDTCNADDSQIKHGTYSFLLDQLALYNQAQITESRVLLYLFLLVQTYAHVQKTQKPIVFLIKASNLGKPRAKLGYCRTHPFCSYHSFKMCVNLPRACATVKITSHVPVISHSSRNMKTRKKFMRVTCVLLRIQKKLLIRKKQNPHRSSSCSNFLCFLALWETVFIITVTCHSIERLHQLIFPPVIHPL